MHIAALCRLVCPAVVTLTIQAAAVTLDSSRDYQVFQRSSIDAGTIVVRGSADSERDAAEVRVDGHAWHRIQTSPPCAFEGLINRFGERPVSKDGNGSRRKHSSIPLKVPLHILTPVILGRSA